MDRQAVVGSPGKVAACVLIAQIPSPRAGTPNRLISFLAMIYTHLASGRFSAKNTGLVPDAKQEPGQPRGGTEKEAKTPIRRRNGRIPAKALINKFEPPGVGCYTEGRLKLYDTMPLNLHFRRLRNSRLQGRPHTLALWPSLCLWLASGAVLPAAETLAYREWKVDGVTREAFVHLPASAKTTPAPVVFVFHGHGGSMTNSAHQFGLHTVWPEAIIVYPQGLNTPGRLTDLEGKHPGWQKDVGDQGDRDLKFFDAMLSSLKQDYKVETKRVYATGHSNGAGFTYLLWEARGEQ